MAVDTPPVSLRWSQGQVFQSDKRFRVLVAGRRFGKSYLACIELLRGAINRPGETLFYCAPTYRMAKLIAWDYLKAFSGPLTGIEQRESDLIVNLPNGARVQLFGADNPDTLRGQYFDGVVFDE